MESDLVVSSSIFDFFAWPDCIHKPQIKEIGL